MTLTTKSLLVTAVLLVAPAAALAGDLPQPPPEPGKTEHAKQEEWQYTMKVKLPGTRSEVRTGILTRDGVEISGKAIGEVLETPYGKLEWCGTAGYRPGWQPHVEKAKTE